MKSNTGSDSRADSLRALAERAWAFVLGLALIGIAGHLLALEYFLRQDANSVEQVFVYGAGSLQACFGAWKCVKAVLPRKPKLPANAQQQ